MQQRTIFLLLLSCASVSFGGLRLSFNLGGTSSYLGYLFNDNSGINIKEQDMRSAMLLGAHVEVIFKETFGFLTGFQTEDKGGTLKGNWISWINGDFEFNYRYLQIPLHAKVIVPLLIPGSIYISAGPEMGFNLERSFTIRLQKASFVQDFDTLTSSYDFGFSGSLGYEIPIGRYFGLAFWGSYFYGLVDIYENNKTATSDFNLYNRTIKFGVSFTAAIAEF
jgi:hypothetical protein